MGNQATKNRELKTDQALHIQKENINRPVSSHLHYDKSLQRVKKLWQKDRMCIRLSLNLCIHTSCSLTFDFFLLIKHKNKPTTSNMVAIRTMHRTVKPIKYNKIYSSKYTYISSPLE